MAAAQHPVGGLPITTTATRRSFADVLASKPTPSASTSSHPYDSDPLKMGLHKGQPAAFFNDNQLQGLSVPYSWSLVGKFSQGYNKIDPKKGRPSLDNLHRYFLTLDFKGAFSLGLLDNRHVIIHMSNEADYLRLYSRMVWYIGPVTMRIFRWSPYFRVDKESPLVPVWITMPRLPIMLFEEKTLLSLASLIGCPLRRDDATIHLKRPSVARIQVEVDLLKPRPDQIWIGLGATDGYWQRIEYESLPAYCQKCWHVGHAEENCRADHLQFKSQTTKITVPVSAATVPVSAAYQRLHQIYVPKIPQSSVSAVTVPPLAEPIVSTTEHLSVVPPAASAPIHSKSAALPSSFTGLLLAQHALAPTTAVLAQQPQQLHATVDPIVLHDDAPHDALSVPSPVEVAPQSNIAPTRSLDLVDQAQQYPQHLHATVHAGAPSPHATQSSSSAAVSFSQASPPVVAPLSLSSADDADIVVTPVPFSTDSPIPLLDSVIPSTASMHATVDVVTSAPLFDVLPPNVTPSLLHVSEAPALPQHLPSPNVLQDQLPVTAINVLSGASVIGVSAASGLQSKSSPDAVHALLLPPIMTESTTPPITSWPIATMPTFSSVHASPSELVVQIPTSQATAAPQKGRTLLSPHAEAFLFPTLKEAYGSQQPTTSSAHAYNCMQDLVQPSYALGHHELGYTAGDYSCGAIGYTAGDFSCGSFESDNLDDEESSYDITEGSEGTVRQKRRDQKIKKAHASSQMVSKEVFAEQSRSLGKKLKKRGRPPGSRNRTFFDVVRTIETRASKSSSL